MNKNVLLIQITKFPTKKKKKKAIFSMRILISANEDSFLVWRLTTLSVLKSASSNGLVPNHPLSIVCQIKKKKKKFSFGFFKIDFSRQVRPFKR